MWGPVTTPDSHRPTVLGGSRGTTLPRRPRGGGRRPSPSREPWAEVNKVVRGGGGGGRARRGGAA